MARDLQDSGGGPERVGEGGFPMGGPKGGGTWEDTGCYELEEIVDSLARKVERLEEKWGVKVEIRVEAPVVQHPKSRS